MLELQNLGLNYPRRADVLQGISAHWQAGEVVGLLGPNGSGKSTLLKALAGLSAYTGRLLWDEADVADWSPAQRAQRICYLPQQATYTQPFLGWEVVMMGGFSRHNRWGQPGRGERERVEQCLARVGAGHLSERPVTAMSGGEVQRVRLAQALAQDAQGWLLDEPTSALDIHQQLEVVELFLQLKAEGKSLLLVLHDLNLVCRLCSRVWVINGGRLCLQGKPDEVFETPEFQRIFQVEMERFQNSAGESILWPKKIDGDSTL